MPMSGARGKPGRARERNRDLLRQFVEHAPAPIAMFDRDMRYIMSSRRFLVDYNLKQRDIIGRSHYEIFPEMPERWKEVHRRCLAGATEKSEAEAFPRLDGSVDWVRWEIQPWYEADGAIGGIILFSEVVTPFMRMQDSLRESEEVLYVMFEKAPFPVALSSLPDGTLVRVNEAFERTFGFTRAEAIGKTAQELGINVDDENRARVLAALNNSGSVRNQEMTLRTKSGEGRVFSVNIDLVEIGGRRYILNTTLDITERRRIEAELSESEARFRATFEQAAVGIAHVAPDGRWLRVNRVLCDMVGYSCEELLAKTFQDITHPGDLGPDLEYVRRMLAGEIETYAMDKRYFHKGGSVVWINLTVTLVRSPSGAPDYFIAVIKDITERRRAEDERRGLEAQLRQAQKMEAIGRLAGGVAHDFNNMLGVILGYAELALADLPEKSPLSANLMQIQSAAMQSADLTRQLLAFARKQTISPVVFDLNEMLSRMIKMLTRIIGENIDLVWSPGPEPYRIRMDPSQINQLLVNLAVNARDAIPGTGTITIETRDVTLDDVYCIMHPGAAPGRYALLIFGDSGRGMSGDTLEHLFEPFFTTKEEGAGTGLGLSTVYGIVKQNHGFIDVLSEVGRGTTLLIYLPRLEEACTEIHAAAVPEPTPAKGETVLVVEDEATILELVKAILEEIGYNVLAVQTPKAALRLAGELRGAIDLLITDVVMPEMNGRDLCRELTAAYPGIKCLYMSGYAADVMGHRGVLDASDAFIQKPFSVSALAEKIREVLDRK